MVGSEFIFQQSTNNEDLQQWILLDNQSTVNIFCNPNLVTNIRDTPRSLVLKCNAGTVRVNQIADLPGYPEPVWFHSKGIANVLSLSRVAKLFPVTFSNKDGFIIHKPEGRKHVFRESKQGLLYLDTATKTGDAIMVMTVKDKQASYSAQDYQCTVLAQKLQHILGHPSNKQLMRIIEKNQLPNCPVNQDDVQAANDIFGKSIGALKGKTVRQKPVAVTGITSPLPPGILEKYRVVTLAFDIMFVNKIAFLVTISRNIQFGTAVRLPSRKETDVIKALKDIVKIYKMRGFKIDTFLADGEFELLQEQIYEIGGVLNTTARDEHMGDVEQYIRTIKEQARASFNLTPFKKMPAVMIQHLVGGCVFWLNAFPHENGISESISPKPSSQERQSTTITIVKSCSELMRKCTRSTTTPCRLGLLEQLHCDQQETNKGDSTS
jgi:hypothetical protein